jgi:hypothetical protein
MQPSEPFLLLTESKLIIWHSEESCKFDFRDKSKVREVAGDLVRRSIVLCAICKGFLKVHGVYSRGLKDWDSSAEYGWVAQLYCAACKKYPALIPDFIIPYKRYKAEVIESVIAEHERGRNIEQMGGCSADISTMRRWVRQFGERGVLAVGWMLSILLSLYGRRISLLKLQNKTLLKQLERLLCEFRIPKTDTVIGSVNILLTTQNCGFL